MSRPLAGSSSKGSHSGVSIIGPRLAKKKAAGHATDGPVHFDAKASGLVVRFGGFRFPGLFGRRGFGGLLGRGGFLYWRRLFGRSLFGGGFLGGSRLSGFLGRLGQRFARLEASRRAPR